MYTVDDIQFFILTGNRLEFLKQAINSVFNSTLKPNSIYVLDYSKNNSETDEYIKSLNDSRINYVSTYVNPEMERYSNYLMIKKLLSKKYLMVIHDDDVLHPNYIQQALNVINKEDKLSLVSCRTMPFKNEDTIIFSDNLSNEYVLIDDKVVFNNLIYSDKFNICYPASIMLSEVYISIDCIELFKKYSKFSDGILLQSFLNNHEIAVINDYGYFYRYHEGQDTNDHSTDLTKDQFLLFLNSVVSDKFKYWNSHMKVWRLSILYNCLKQSDKQELKLSTVIGMFTNPINLYLFYLYNKKYDNIFYIILWNIYKYFWRKSNNSYSNRMQKLIDKYTIKYNQEMHE